jgi:hypothetical protein
LPDGSFSIKDLGLAIARVLGLQEGEVVEVQKDKTNPNRVLVIRHGQQEQKPT